MGRFAFTARSIAECIPVIISHPFPLCSLGWQRKGSLSKDTKNCPKPTTPAANSRLLMRVPLISGCQGEGPSLIMLQLLDPNTTCRGPGWATWAPLPTQKLKKANGETGLWGSGEPKRHLHSHFVRLRLSSQVQAQIASSPPLPCPVPC